MNLFFDECVSAGAAVHFRTNSPHAACHTRDVNLSGVSDDEILSHCVSFNQTLITINGRDFRKLCGPPDTIHPGLIILPSVSKARQIDCLTIALNVIAQEAPPETPEDWMVNRVVEVDSEGSVSHAELPHP